MRHRICILLAGLGAACAPAPPDRDPAPALAPPQAPAPEPAPVLVPIVAPVPAAAADTGGWLRTDSAEYTSRFVEGEGAYAQYGFRVVTRFANRTGAPVYLASCYGDNDPIYHVQLVGSDYWADSGYAVAWACVGHDRPIVVAPGAVRTDTLHLKGPNAWNGYTDAPFGALEGSFRVRYEAQSCTAEVGCPHPDSLATSNAFQVRLVRDR